MMAVMNSAARLYLVEHCIADGRCVSGTLAELNPCRVDRDCRLNESTYAGVGVMPTQLLGAPRQRRNYSAPANHAVLTL